MTRTRTNIEIDDELIGAVMRRFRLRTKTEAVHLALEHLAEEPLDVEEILALEGARLVGEVSPDRPPRAEG